MVLKEKEKHKGHKSCEQNKNRGIPIIVEEERWDANRGIPKLRCLVVLEYYRGVPWASQSLGFRHSLFYSPSNLYPKLENFTTQNSTENS